MTDWSEHEFDSVVDKAKALHSMLNIVEVAELLGLEPDHNLKVHSPYNDADHTPSCQLYEPDHFFCYSTGKGGDAIDLVMAITGRTWGQALGTLWNRGLRAGFEPGRHEAVSKPPAVDLTEQFHLAWSQSDMTKVDVWAGKLGLPSDWVFRLQDWEEIAFVGDDLWIAHWQDDESGQRKVRGIKTRALAGGKGSITGSQYSHGLYDPSLCHGRTAVIVEGESDCWALGFHWSEAPVHVYALPCGAGVWRSEWLAQLEGYESIWLAFDRDDAGRRATEKVTRAIGWDRTQHLQIPGLYNDVREAYLAGWRPGVPT